MSHLSIIIPTLNEEKWIEPTLLRVKECAPDAEILVVDGGSSDATVVRASKHARIISAKRGRGGQLNAGVAATQGDILLFLHADTLPEAAGLRELMEVMQDEHILGGAFRMRFDDTGSIYKRICENVTQRSLHTRSYTGDQGIFTRRSTFQQLGGHKVRAVGTSGNTRELKVIGSVASLQFINATLCLTGSIVRYKRYYVLRSGTKMQRTRENYGREYHSIRDGSPQ